MQYSLASTYAYVYKYAYRKSMFILYFQFHTHADSQRTITMDSSFFVGYKKTCLKPDEVLVSVLIPFSNKVNTFQYTQHSIRITCPLYV